MNLRRKQQPNLSQNFSQTGDDDFRSVDKNVYSDEPWVGQIDSALCPD
jgi:hypothetical protein